MLKKIAEILSFPILLLNVASGIVGGIWLAILGEWVLVGIGILWIFFIGDRVFSTLLLLGLPIGAISDYFVVKKNPLHYLFSFLYQFYANLLIIGSFFLAFIACSYFHPGDISVRYVPYLLWSWNIAIGPLQDFANNDSLIIHFGSAAYFYLFYLLIIFISPLWGLIMVFVFVIVQLFIIPIFILVIEGLE